MEKGDHWVVEPSKGVLESLSRLTLTVKVKLYEVGYHNCSIHIDMTQPFEHNLVVDATAVGIGSPIEFNPPLTSVLNFGTIFM